MHRCSATKVSTAFAHGSVTALAEFVVQRAPELPQPKYLLLLRTTIEQRTSYFLEKVFHYTQAEDEDGEWTDHLAQKARDQFHDWIRSDAYDHNFFNLQIEKYASLMPRTPSDGSHAAEMLRANNAVAWIGVSDDWAMSMCLLERVLGIAQFYSFARKSKSRMTVDLSRTRLLERNAFMDNMSDEMYKYIIDKEVKEISFVTNVQYHNTREYYAEAACNMVPSQCDSHVEDIRSLGYPWDV